MADAERPDHSGAVLCGGLSSRMGVDKALLEVDGIPLASQVAQALVAAGASEVVAVGGDSMRLQGLGLRWVPDRHPGEGPLGAIITALEALASNLVVVCACDMPGISDEAVSVLLAGIEDDPAALVAVASHGGRRHPLLGVYRRAALDPLARAFASGTRSVAAALATVEVRAVPAPAAWVQNINTPDDLQGAR